MKTHSTSPWTIVAFLLIGMIVGITPASGQNSSGNSSGAKLWVTAMDKDRDGTVSKEEFTAYMDAQFDKADPDHDGVLDRKEMELLRKNLGIAESASNSSGAKLWLTSMDKDGDGTVSKQEFTAYMGDQFDKADADHDSTLDRNEMEQLRKNLGIAEKQ
jgi:Ca2+-binding EF-hand superfamily protein